MEKRNISKALQKLIKEAVPNRIVKMLYNCQNTNDYSELNMYNYLNQKL